MVGMYVARTIEWLHFIFMTTPAVFVTKVVKQLIITFY